jgi:O-antigen/teichoic acid export membrane protein
MRSRLLWRRSATAAGLYASVGFGILGTVVAARSLGLDGFGLFATALAAAALFQTLLDLTVEESLTKYGFRYIAGGDWGKLRRLFVLGLEGKLLGGVVAALVLAALAPAADALFDTDGLVAPMLVAALLPLVQAPENVGTSVLLLRGRYDLRGAYQSFSLALRLVGIAVGCRYGVVEAIAGIVVAQAVSTLVVSVVGLVAFRRFPAAPQAPLADDRRGVLSFVLQSSAATGLVSLRTALAPLVLGLVSGPTQVGLLRVAQAPQSGFAAASSPVRLILLTEQTRDWEHGNERRVMAGVTRYMKVALGVLAVAIPLFWLTIPWLVETLFGADYDGAVSAARIVLLAASIHLLLGWSKSLPTTVGRPGLRILTHGIETLVLLPLVAWLGARWGVTGAAVAILASSVVFAATWAVLLVQLRAEVASRAEGGAARSALVP